jgi:hypothetical protein
MSSVSVNNRVADRQPQPVSTLLRREIRIENLAQDTLRDADSLILDGYFDIPA